MSLRVYQKVDGFRQGSAGSGAGARISYRHHTASLRPRQAGARLRIQGTYRVPIAFCNARKNASFRGPLKVQNFFALQGFPGFCLFVKCRFMSANVTLAMSANVTLYVGKRYVICRQTLHHFFGREKRLSCFILIPVTARPFTCFSYPAI